MIVCWESKRLKDSYEPELSKTLGKRYRRLGDAWYKMYQLTLKGYEGVHCDFEEYEKWHVGGVVFDEWDDGSSLYEDDNKWYFQCERKRVDITDQIEYYDKYRIKKETA
jgi:hypothetical protein